MIGYTEVKGPAQGMRKQSYQFQLNGKGTHYCPEKCHVDPRNLGSGPRQVRSSFTIKENWGWGKRDTHTVKESRKEPRVKWILCPGIGWRLIVSDWEYLLKFCVHKLQLSFPSLTLYSVPYKLSWEQNIYIQKCLLQHCLWRRKSILNNMTPFLDIICVCRSTQRKQLKNMHTSLVLCEVKF